MCWRDCGYSVEIVWGKCGDIVGRVWICCGESVESVWGELWESVGRVCKECGDSLERVLRVVVFSGERCW